MINAAQLRKIVKQFPNKQLICNFYMQTICGGGVINDR